MSVLKQNSPIKQIAISRVTNSIRALLRSQRQTCGMEMVFFEHVALKTQPGAQLIHRAALSISQRPCCSAPSERQQHQSNPVLPVRIRQISLLKNKPIKTDSNCFRGGGKES